MGWSTLNLVSTCGAVLLIAGGVLLLYNLFVSARVGALAPANPWNADSLEWATSSPPPVYNFLDIPVVEGRHALWDRSAERPIVTGIRSDVREVLVTSVTDAEPLYKDRFPEPSIWPFLASVATTALFIGSVFTPWAVVYGALPVFVTLVGWFWPKRPATERAAKPRLVEIRSPRPLAPGVH
jgi:hypothetical protein